MSRVITDSGFFHAMNAERSDEMAVFRIERTRDYTVMSNHHLRDKALSLKSNHYTAQVNHDMHAGGW